MPDDSGFALPFFLIFCFVSALSLSGFSSAGYSFCRFLFQRISYDSP
ncbi:hypothetical protein CLOM621_05988 [Clostridium sp. M62/1]|nr:hypothetical protein CLOM621_05988 [Clostridium sp. M62/1]CBK78379.1 hypothetical protein CLS_31110 [[Clostridium] cf. saccharolyticum K10]